MAGLTEVPASIVTVDDRRQLELALVENLQRSDLSPLDRSQAYRVLMDEFGLTQEAVAAALGVSRSAVANALRLLSLDEASLAALREGEITEGHARALLAVTDRGARSRLLQAIKRQGLSVREAEQWALAPPSEGSPERTDGATARAAPSAKDDVWSREVVSVIVRIQRNLGTRVRLRGGEARGRLELEYYSEEELAELIERLSAV